MHKYMLTFSLTLVALLLLSGCSITPTSSGDNDSPIVVSDTSTTMQRVDTTARYSDPINVERYNVQGSNNPFNYDGHGNFYVHDRGGFANILHYKAVCFDNGSGTPIQLEVDKPWYLSFKYSGQEVFRLEDNGDKSVRLGGTLTTVSATKLNVLQKQFDKVEWSINHGSPVSYDTHSVTVHYCKNGKCKDTGEPCH